MSQRDDLPARVEAERARDADNLQVGALGDLRQEGLGALDLAEDEGVLDADDARLLGLREADAVERVLDGPLLSLRNAKAIQHSPKRLSVRAD